MNVLHDKRARIAGLAVFLGAALLLLPVRSDPVNPFGFPTAHAGAKGGSGQGHEGGGQTHLPNNESYNSYSSYSASPANGQNGEPVPCQSCEDGEWGR